MGVEFLLGSFIARNLFDDHYVCVRAVCGDERTEFLCVCIIILLAWWIDHSHGHTCTPQAALGE